MRRIRVGWLTLALVGGLSACGGGSSGTPVYSVGGTVSGLPSGSQLTLIDNGVDTATISANGGFQFAKALAQNSSYSVSVGSMPAGEVCTVANGTGSSITSNVSNITVSCASSTSSYTIGGQVSGLAASANVVLLDNNADPLTVSSNASFTFPTKIASGGGYAVTVGTQPAGQTCSVSNGSGSGVNANVTNVSVVCANNATSSYTIGGSVSGLPSGQQLSLVDNGDSAHALTVSGNGTFSFPQTVSGAYAVTVGTQPSGATCTVSNGSGTATANVSNVSVACTSTSYTIGGSVSGLSSGQTATLELNGDAANTVSLSSTSTSFTFPTSVAAGSNYAVTVSTQPTSETCTVTGGNGTANANVTSVSVSCATTTASNLTFSSGFAASNLTVEGGAYGGYGGSSLDGNATYGPSSGSFGGPVSVTTTAANSYFGYYYQFPATALPSNVPTYEYMGVYTFAPGVTALNGSGDTSGVSINGQNNLQFTFNENAEWAQAPSSNFLIILTLGKYYNIGTVASPTACNLQLQDVVQPSTPAAATTITVPLSDFTVAQNCGQAISTAAQALAVSPISKIDLQGDGGTSALTQGANHLTSSANFSVSTQATGGAAPYQVPTVIVLKGPITFTP
jgi:hypothetical protein